MTEQTTPRDVIAERVAIQFFIDPTYPAKVHADAILAALAAAGFVIVGEEADHPVGVNKLIADT